MIDAFWVEYTDGKRETIALDTEIAREIEEQLKKTDSPQYKLENGRVVSFSGLKSIKRVDF